LLSLYPLVEITSFWQRVVAIAFGPISVLAAPIADVNDPKKVTAMAMGGFMLFRREAYQSVGGHESVKNQIIEDFALASRVKSAGWRLLALPAPELVKTDYFDTVREIWLGARRNLYGIINYRPGLLLFYSAVFIAITYLPWIGLAVSVLHANDRPPGLWPLIFLCALFGIFCTSAMCGFAAYVSRAPLFYAFSFPLAVAFLLCAAWSGAWRLHFGSGVEWKGRTIASQDLRRP
jgi:cellulose synthase/poly-beta-1,6-N-acetylglucosamine synthase-like glycosyltransferase